MLVLEQELWRLSILIRHVIWNMIIIVQRITLICGMLWSWYCVGDRMVLSEIGAGA